MSKSTELTFFDDSAEDWERALYGFLARWTSSRPTVPQVERPKVQSSRTKANGSAR